MTHVSRPFQIALLAVGLLAAVWFVALRGHSSTTSGSGPAQASKAAVSSPSAASEAKAAAAPTPVYHGAAPGVEGLTRAIAKAHEAVAKSQQDAKRFEHESAQATTPSVSTTPRPTTTSRPAATKKTAPAASGTSNTGPNRVPARQALVEQELKQGAVVAVLFWNPKSSVDVAVHNELQLLLAVHHKLRSVSKVPVVQRLLKAVGLELDSKIAVQEASASQVASFGSITRAVQVDQTPTILIINGHGQTTTLTGLTDAFSIEQAIDEARHA